MYWLLCQIKTKIPMRPIWRKTFWFLEFHIFYFDSFYSVFSSSKSRKRKTLIWLGNTFSKGVFSSNIFFIRFIRHSTTTTPEFDNHPCMCHLPYFNDFNLFFCTLKIDVDLCSEHNRTAILFSNHFYIFGHWVDLHLYDCMHDSYTTTFVVQKATKKSIGTTKPSLWLLSSRWSSRTSSR